MNKQLLKYFLIQRRIEILRVTLPQPQIRDVAVRKAIHYLQIQQEARRI
jgi:hypothetical protein